MRKVILWEEPNRGETPPLHIADRGERFSTLTGIWWIDDYRFLVNHRNGKRLALFDIREGDEPVHKVAIPHLNDDVAAWKKPDGTWDVVTSGCWAFAYSKFTLDDSGFKLVETKRESFWFRLPSRIYRYFKQRTFAHGTCYSKDGTLVVTFHTGENPRIINYTTNTTYYLPVPWGARDACFDEDGNLYAVAVSTNPKLDAYKDTSAAIWKLTGDQFEMVAELPGGHFDTCCIYDGKLYTNNQYKDTVTVYDLEGDGGYSDIDDPDLCFPHGVSVSPNGKLLAVANYGSSTIVVREL